MSSWESSASHCIGDRIASHRWLCQRASSRHANKFLAFCRKYSYFHFQLRQNENNNVHNKMVAVAETKHNQSNESCRTTRQKNILFDQKAKKPKPVRLALTFRPAKKKPAWFWACLGCYMCMVVVGRKRVLAKRTRHGAHVWHSICARCQVSSIAPAAGYCRRSEKIFQLFPRRDCWCCVSFCWLTNT